MIEIFQIKVLLFFFTIISINQTVFGSPNADSVTLVKKEFPVITVEGKKNSVENVLKYTSSSIISKTEIIEINTNNLSGVLQYQPGILIRDYGGLGGLKTISVRGTNSMQTLITFEGIRLNSSQTSMIDLNKIPISIIDEIQIFKGGSSSISGSNSIAGVINLETKKYIENDALNLKISYGSFNEIEASADLNLGSSYQIVSNLDYQHSDGNFPFFSNQFGEEKKYKRENGNFDRFSFYLFKPIINKSFSLRPFLLLSLIERGSPGAVLQGHIESLDARLNELFWIFCIPTDFQISTNSELKTNFNYKFEKTDYSNPEFSFLSADGKIKYNYQEIQFSSVYSNNIINDLNFFIGLDFITTKLYGNMLDKNIGERVSRYNISGYFNFDYKLESNEYMILSTNLGFRGDAVLNLNPNYSYSFGANLNLLNYDLKIKSLFSNNFRLPSFNEMYYLNYGNSNLKPEKSYNLNIGLVYELNKNLNFEINGFFLKTYDQIVSVPLSPLRWSAKNIAETFSRGFEFSSKASFFDNFLNLKINYTFQMMTDESQGSNTKGKLIVYTPQELINSTISIKAGLANAVVQLFYSSHRFYLPQNDYNGYLPSYFLINFSLFRDFRFFNNDFRLRIDLENIFDRRYEIIRNYPMPGFSLKVGFAMNFLFQGIKYD